MMPESSSIKKKHEENHSLAMPVKPPRHAILLVLIV